MGKASRPFLGAIFIAFAVAGASSAGPYEDAVAAHERADYATATRLWRPLAERGDPAAQLMLGSMFHDGLGVPQDFAEALNWFRRTTGTSRAEALAVMQRLGIDSDRHVDVGALAMNPRTLLALETAFARGAEVVVFLDCRL